MIFPALKQFCFSRLKKLQVPQGIKLPILTLGYTEFLINKICLPFNEFLSHLIWFFNSRWELRPELFPEHIA